MANLLQNSSCVIEFSCKNEFQGNKDEQLSKTTE